MRGLLRVVDRLCVDLDAQHALGFGHDLVGDEADAPDAGPRSNRAAFRAGASAMQPSLDGLQSPCCGDPGRGQVEDREQKEMISDACETPVAGF